MAKNKTDNPLRKGRPEKRLLAFWKRRTRPDGTVMAKLVDRNPELVAEELRNHLLDPTRQANITHKIATGAPLTFEEYHIAIAMHWLLTEMPYEEFFKTRWHEDASHYGYGPAGRGCPRCP